MNYRIVAHKWVVNFLNKLDPVVSDKIRKVLKELVEFPQVSNIKHLFNDVYRKRIGVWRAFFKVYPDKAIIVIFDIQPREKAYKHLKESVERVK